MINFKARYIPNTNGFKVTSIKNKPMKNTISLVEFNPKNKCDLKTLKDTDALWGGDTFAKIIYDYAKDESKEDVQRALYYGLVKQKDGFRKVNPKNVLGMAQVLPINKTLVHLNLLQVSPSEVYKTKGRKLKYIGLSIIDAIKNLFPQSDIIVEPAKSARDFYLNNGFVEIYDGYLVHHASQKSTF